MQQDVIDLFPFYAPPVQKTSLFELKGNPVKEKKLKFDQRSKVTLDLYQKAAASVSFCNPFGNLSFQHKDKDRIIICSTAVKPLEYQV